MKMLLALAATLIAFSAQASDRKLGNVIAVEREINNIYEACTQNLIGESSKEQAFFACGINFLKSSVETPISKGGLLRFQDSTCSVNADAGNGVMVVTFGKTKTASTLEAAKVCLQRALQERNSVRVLVYTLE